MILPQVCFIFVIGRNFFSLSSNIVIELIISAGDASK